MNNKPIKIGIIGGGSVGVTLAVLLSSFGYDIELVVRTIRGIKVDNKYSYDIDGDFGKVNAFIKTYKKIDKLSNDLDFIIIATKSFDSIEVAMSCKNKLSEKGAFVIFQNVFTLNKIGKILPPDRTICAVLDMNIKHLNKVFNVKNFNGINIGVYSYDAYDKMMVLNDVFSNICNVNICSDIVGFIMGRTILNVAISSIGAVSGLCLEDILISKVYKKIFINVIYECVKTIKKMNIKIVPYNDLLDYDKFSLNTFKGYFYRRKILKVMAINNGEVRSSALNDLEHGRKTDLCFFMDTIINFANKNKIKIPFIKRIYSMINEIENNRRRVSKNAFCIEYYEEIKENKV